MVSSTKRLLLLGTILIALGLVFVWFGSKPEVVSSPVPSPFPESTSIATSSATFGVEGERMLVTDVVDGDTIKIEGDLTVRLLGVDTPETKDPRKPVGCFGKEASNETRKLISLKAVILEKDISETDKYGRLLRYVFLPLEGGQLVFVNDYLIREGFAKVLTYPPDVKYTEQFLEAQRKAKEMKKGLWSKC